LQIADDGVLDQYRPDIERENQLAQKFRLPGLAFRLVKGVVYLVGVAANGSVLDGLREGTADDPTIKWVDSSAVVMGLAP
ncbi:MAG TPA: hypothetical protein HPP80_07240, partial [Rhodospirillaceae bacterium]|nr:hypothetical protein [Rhodospirillaceae bacterium]